MIVRGTSVKNTGKTLSIASKAFLALLSSIDDSDLMAMDSIDLLTIINQGILPNNEDIRGILTTEPFSDERKRNLEKIKDKINRGEDIASDSNEDEIPEDNEDGKVEDVEEIPNKEDKEEKKKEDKSLAKLNLIKSIKSIDNSLINAIDDKEAIEVLFANKLRKVWELIINNEITIDDIIKEYNNSGKYSKIVFERFINEYNSVVNYSIPSGFNAHKVKNGAIFNIVPNLMQKLMVYRLKKNHYYGNWSGMGSGKTLSAIIASREIESHLTIIVGVNSTISQWKDEILNAFPENTGTRVYIANDKEYGKIKYDMEKYNYLLIPFSRLSQYGEEASLKSVAENKVDFIVIDEVHKAKTRGEDSEESKRRKNLVKFIGWSKETNSELYKMAMSGTPIINELSEAKSLLSLLTDNAFDDIKTKRTLSNALKLHQMLLIHGLRFVPKYDQELNILTGDNCQNLNINGDKYLNILKGLKSIETEKLFVEDKLNAIKPYLKKGVLIYTHYTTDVIKSIRDYVESLGFITSLYSDNRDSRENELLRFRNGKSDIMIASDPINTGVDRLQEVCDTMILMTLPWTNADFEQLKGRIYRQGMASDASVTIIIPQVIVHDASNTIWSWDKQRFDLIKSKKTLADCVIDGVIPMTKFYTRETLYKKSVESLKLWKERINNGEFLIREDEGINVDLNFEDIDKRPHRDISFISEFNRIGKQTEHNKFHIKMNDNPNLFFEYHKARRESMKEWDEIPYEYIAKKIKNKHRIVADFGCGENKLKELIKDNKVYSFDHIAFDESVIACDMAHTPLGNESVDIAVFSLSLWGSDFEDYFKEAYRILNYDGIIYIAEPSKSYTEEERMKLVKLLNKNGFTMIGNIEDRGKFFYISLIKK